MTTGIIDILRRSTSPGNPNTGYARLYIDAAGSLRILGDGSSSLLPDRGDWTPILAGSTTAGTHTYTTQVGRWVKKGGPSVEFYFGILINTKDAAMAGDAMIIGLPFVSRTQAGLVYTGSPVTPVNLVNNVVDLHCRVSSNSNVITIRKMAAAAGSTVALAAADIQNGTGLFGTVSFELP